MPSGPAHKMQCGHWRRPRPPPAQLAQASAQLSCTEPRIQVRKHLNCPVVILGVAPLSAAVTVARPFDTARSAMAAPSTVRNLMPSPAGVGAMPRTVGLLVALAEL